MKDIVFEWFIPRIPDGRQRLIKAVMISAALVFLFDAVFFAAGMLIPSVVLMVVGFFLFRSWKIEYEYEYVNGDLTVSKIIRREKRKEVYRTSRSEIEEVQTGRVTAPGRETLDFTSGRPNKAVYTLKIGGKMVCVEASEEFVRELRRYYQFT